MSNISVRIAASADDATCTTNAILDGDDVGVQPEIIIDKKMYLRFQLNTIKKQAKINSATITFRAFKGWSDDYNTTIDMENVANAAVFADAETLQTRNWIGGVTWNTAAWNINDTVVTVDISLLVSIAVGHPDWVPGNYIAFEFSPGGTKEDNDYSFYSWDYDNDNATTWRALLNIEYLDRTYTRGDEPVLPGDDTDLETVLGWIELAYVDIDDGLRVAQSACHVIEEFALFQFKNISPLSQTGGFKLTWNGQVSIAASDSTVYLQVYNYNSTSWENLASNNVTAANTDFNLIGTISANTANYYSGGYICGRVYQEAIAP